MTQKRVCRSTTDGISFDTNNCENGVGQRMTTLGDLFGDSFYSNGSGNDGANASGKGSNSENVLATNLTPTNNGIARQSNLMDAMRVPRIGNRYPLFFADRSSRNDQFAQEDIMVDLSRRVNNLSVAERQEAQNDLYGFRLKNRIEDPVELGIWMNEMDEAIATEISGNDKRYSALRLAMHTNTAASDSMSMAGDTIGCNVEMTGAEYVRSQRLKFLRSCDWKSKDAVLRLARYLELKLEYFGSESLTRDLTLNDLSKTDLELWRTYGFFQLAEERDAYGRATLLVFGKRLFPMPLDTVIRVLLYLSMILARDESIQLMGCCYVFWGVGQTELGSKSRTIPIVEAFRAIPLRGIARHICYDGLTIIPLFDVLAKVCITWGAIRMRLHQGTALECAYNLMTFGISQNSLPVDNNGEVECEFHRSFLDAISRKEADEENIRRRERLDRQIREFQNLNQSFFNDERSKSQEVMGRQVEPYQREPPIMPIQEEDDKFDILFKTSNESEINMSGLSISEFDPLSLRSETLDFLPDDFVNRLSGLANSNTSTTSHNLVSQMIESQDMKTGLQDPSTRNSVPNIDHASSGNKSEEQSGKESKDFVVVPGVFDVIMGRGRHNKKKPGNRKLYELLEAYEHEYEASDKFQKTVLSEIVVSKMMAEGSRFLVREGEKKHGVWVEVSVEKARDKVAHDFRNLRRNARLAKEHAIAPTVESSQKRRLSLQSMEEENQTFKRGNRKTFEKG